MIPSEWRPSNFTAAACSAPDCGNNMEAFQRCCNGTIASFDPSKQTAQSNTSATAGLRMRQEPKIASDGTQFLTCSIDSDVSGWDSLSTEPSPYLDYQNCLIRAESEFFKCNTPQGETLNDCSVGMRSSPSGEGEVACATENRPNSSSTLRNCCDSELNVYGYGCYAWCSGGSDLQQCVDSGNDRGSAPAIFCRNSTDVSDSDTGGDALEEDSDAGAGTSGAAATARKTSLMACLVLGIIFMGLLH